MLEYSASFFGLKTGHIGHFTVFWRDLIGVAALLADFPARIKNTA